MVNVFAEIDNQINQSPYYEEPPLSCSCIGMVDEPPMSHEVSMVNGSLTIAPSVLTFEIWIRFKDRQSLTEVFVS